MAREARGSSPRMMGDTPHRGPSPLLEEIQRTPEKFSFFQIMMILEREGYLQGQDGKSLQFKPYNKSKSVEGEVAKVTLADEGLRAEVSPTFLGLYGPSSPLPKFYSEELDELDQNDVHHVRQLLDTISSRIYCLYYAAQKKYHPITESFSGSDGACLDFIYGLLGLREKIFRQKAVAPIKLLRLASVISQKPCSTAGLITILEDAFYPVQAKVVECLKETMKIPLPQSFCLGVRSNILSYNAIIGEEIEDKRGNLRIELGPLTQEQFRTFVGDGGSWDELLFLIRFYITQPLQVVLRLILGEGECVTTQLGSQHYGMLGKNTWLLNRDVSARQMISDYHLSLAMEQDHTPHTTYI